LSWWGVCVDSQTVMRPSSPAIAALARGSSGHAARRGLITAPLVVTLARAEQIVAGVERAVHAGVRADLGEQARPSSRADSMMSVTAGSGS